MIDIIFLLLVFFISTSTLAIPESRLTPALQTSQNDSGDSSADFVPQVVEVTVIDNEPVFKIGARVIRDQESLQALLADLPKELGVFVRVSDAVPVGFAVSGLQGCRDAGFEKVTYVPASK